MKKLSVLLLAGSAALAVGAWLYSIAISQASLRFVPCKNYYRLDAADAYCRSPTYYAIAGIILGACGITLLAATALRSLWHWLRRWRAPSA